MLPKSIPKTRAHDRYTCEVKYRACNTAVAATVNPKGMLFIQRGKWALYPVRLGRYCGQNVMVYTFNRGVAVVNPKSNKVLAFLPYSKIPTPRTRANPNLCKQKKPVKKVKKKAEKNPVSKPKKASIPSRASPPKWEGETYALVEAKMRRAEREARTNSRRWV